MTQSNEIIDDFIYQEKQDRKRIVHCIGVYLCNQAFGGREEGGWWYDTGQLVRIVKIFRREEKAWSYVRRLNARLQSRKFGPNEGRREYSSVLSNGEYRAHIYENSCPDYFPSERPHYE